MVVFAVTNQKGGVGKTTTAVSLAASFAAMRTRVLLIDLDSQCNATVAAGSSVDQNQATLSEVLLGKSAIEDAISQTEHGFDILPSNHRLTAAEFDLISQDRKEYVLKQHLDSVSQSYHYILIDCPPALNIMTINALVASQSAIIPVQCEYLALEGLAKLLKTIEALKINLDTSIKIDGLLRTMFDGRNLLTRQVSDQLVGSFGSKVYQTVIPRNVRLAEAPSHGMPIVSYDKRSLGAAAYLALAAEIMRRQQTGLGGTRTLLGEAEHAG
tara:strand:+ start:185 stop:994 length:810 start_codon:yes stop_codon:yes gene_type:complete